MDTEQEAGQTKRGEASERLIHALAAEFPSIHSRQTLVESDSLRRRFGKGPNEPLSDKEQRAVSKTLGRLIGDATISESLWLHGNDDKVALRAVGLIAVSVDIASLRQAWIVWQKAHRTEEASGEGRSSDELGRDPEPTQELIVSEIILKSREWIGDNTVNGKLPLALTNISIIHGSDAFDILITAISADVQHFLQYTREVVQRADHVAGTHTMQIAQSYGFPKLRDFP